MLAIIVVMSKQKEIPTLTACPASVYTSCTPKPEC